MADQIGREFWQRIDSILQKAEFDCQVATLNIAGLAQPFAGCCHIVCGCQRSAYVEKSDHRHRWLLPAPRKRPHRRTAESSHEIAPSKAHLSLPC
jgi:hypothetical protein